MFGNKSIQLLVLLLAGAWIAVSTMFLENRDSRIVSAAMEGFLAPGLQAEDVDGKLVNLEQFRGQVVLLNLWASWCQPCRAEMPAMENVYQALKDQGFTILAVNMTSQDEKANAIAFTEQLGITFPVLFDSSGEAARSFNMQALPTSFFIDRDGIIRSIVVGGPMPESLVYSKALELLEEN